MTLEVWINTYEAYLAIFRGIFFVLALYTSITAGFNMLGMLTVWHSNNCRGTVSWQKISIILTIHWSIYALLGYCITVGRMS
jgi:hypothetical protein